MNAFTLVQSFLALALFLQHLENFKLRKLPRMTGGLFHPQIYSAILLLGLIAAVALPYLLILTAPLSMLALAHLFLFASIFMVALSFGGNFNGGADQMSIQIALATLAAVTAGLLRPELTEIAQRFALLYISVQLSLSYFVSGITKITKTDWRSGKALQEILQSRSYDVSSWAKKSFANSKAPCLSASWLVMLLELGFPLVLLKPNLAFVFLPMMLLFHLGNFMVLGLNRFVFIWLAAYPALLSL